MFFLKENERDDSHSEKLRTRYAGRERLHDAEVEVGEADEREEDGHEVAVPEK